MFLVCFSNCLTTSTSPTNSPFELAIFIPTFFKSSLFFTSLLNTSFNPLPAIPLLIAWSPISPRDPTASSNETPNVPADPAAYLNDSPSISTVTLVLLIPHERTSANLPVSLAVILKAVRLSVIISDTIATSSPDAAAKSNTPGILAIISLVLNPASAIFSIAAAASPAVNLVVAPSLLASFSRSLNSSAVAPDIA